MGDLAEVIKKADEAEAKFMKALSEMLKSMAEQNRLITEQLKGLTAIVEKRCE